MFRQVQTKPCPLRDDWRDGHVFIKGAPAMRSAESDDDVAGVPDVPWPEFSGPFTLTEICKKHGTHVFFCFFCNALQR